MDNGKIALVFAGNIENAPYHLYYTRILDKIKIDYDIFSWDRLSLGPKGQYCFSLKSPDYLPFYKKMIDFYRYSCYVKKILLKEKYKYVVVFTLANVVFLGKFLIKNYPKRYLIDIRDYSPLLPYLKGKINNCFYHALQVTVSSIGFIKWLPAGKDYILCHNVNYEYLSKSEDCIINLNRPIINVVSFGLIRDHEVYKKLLTDLSTSEKYKIKLTGVGTEPLQNYASENDIKNVVFGGRYTKDEEKNLLVNADFIFIMLPRSIAHDGIMSNRFYHAIVNRKPMIVNEGNIQSEYVQRFNLGIVIRTEDNILNKLNDYITGFNSEIFNDGCRKMLDIIKKDMEFFEKNLTAKLTK